MCTDQRARRIACSRLCVSHGESHGFCVGVRATPEGERVPFGAITQLSPPDRTLTERWYTATLAPRKGSRVMEMGSGCGTRGGAVQQHHESPPSHSPHVVYVRNHRGVVRGPE